MRDMGRHEPRHESRPEPRIEPRHELRIEPRPEPRMEPRHEPRMEPRMEPRHEPRIESRHEPRHEPRMETRHEPRHELRHEPRWEPPEKTFRNEKDDWADLPEDARDPWGDDPLPPPKETRGSWGQPSQPNPISAWARDKPTESSWSSKPNFPINTMGSGAGNIGGNVNANIPNPNMNMGMSMNNPNKSVWQNAPQQPQQPNRNQNWLPPGNWQGAGINQGNAGGQGVGIGGMLLGNTLANWQPSQQSFANFSARPFNNNPFMNNRR